jgi:hypothetical protein
MLQHFSTDYDIEFRKRQISTQILQRTDNIDAKTWFGVDPDIGKRTQRLDMRSEGTINIAGAHFKNPGTTNQIVSELSFAVLHDRRMHR